MATAKSVAQLRAQLIQRMDSEVRAAGLVAAREILTEENTDALIEILMHKISGYLPFWLRWLPINSILDKLLPEAVLSVVEDLLRA